MGTQGSFGYKIGRKVRLMHVQYDADLLWQILVREIYVLMKKYGSINILRSKFEELKDAKNRPKPEAIENCKIFTDLQVSYTNTTDWYCLTRHCQHSFINILETGYFLNNGQHSGLIFLLDFNTSVARFYGVDYDKKETEYHKVTIEEIMEFEDMPTKSYEEIISEMREKYEEHTKRIEEVEKDIENIENVIKKANELGCDQNIISQARVLLSDKKYEKTHIESQYRFFYNRLDALNLIDHQN